MVNNQWLKFATNPGNNTNNKVKLLALKLLMMEASGMGIRRLHIFGEFKVGD